LLSRLMDHWRHLSVTTVNGLLNGFINSKHLLKFSLNFLVSKSYIFCQFCALFSL
jgi:hypothetical protein